MAGFADELRRLRQKVGGPGYRELARRAHYSATTLAEAARGDRFPSLAVTLAYVRACGGAVDEWEVRWHEVADQLAAERAPADEGESAPYLGLGTFQAEDANRFFGRDQLVVELTAKVSATRFVAVFGASGVGKSSLLRAGLAPRIANVIVMTPGPHPVEECAARFASTTGMAVDRAAGEMMADPRALHRMPRTVLPGADDELVLVVDQFEEVFTLCQDEAERAAFIAMVTVIAREEYGLVSVVLGVRADFYAQCAEYPALVEALRDAQVLVGPMGPEDLREVVVRPAREQGYVVEGALLAAITADAVGQAGALPLVSHALLETWRRRRGNTFTLAGYQAAGGIHGALAATAERIYAMLTNDQRRAARDLFLRLTTFGEGTEHTRRRVARAELEPDVDPLLNILAAARLITLDESTVDLAHEALIHAWPRLGGWLADDRAGLRVHRQLTEAAHTWQSFDRDDGVLYRGVRLALAREWLADRHPRLTSVEQAFLDMSVRRAEAEQIAAARRARLLRYLVAGLAVLLVVAAGLGAVAWQQRGDAVAMHRVAVSRDVAGRAVALAGSQPGTAMLLSAAAFRLSPTVEARGALLSTAADNTFQAEFAGHTDAVSRAVFSQDGGVLATVSRDRTLRLWDVTKRARIAVLTGHDTWLRTVALSPGGRYAVTGGDDAVAMVWNLERRTRSASLAGHRGRIQGTAFTPDGSKVVTADDTGLIQVWRTGDWTRPTATLHQDGVIRTMSISRDGRTLATADEDGHVILWDLASGTVRATVAAHTGPVADIAINPDNTLLATAGYDGIVGLWRLGDGGAVSRLTGHTDYVRAVEFTPNGRTVVSVSDDRSIMLWDTRLLIPSGRLTGLTHNVYTLAIHPRTGVVATAGEDRKVVLWNVTRPPLFLAGGADGTGDVAYSPDGRWLATANRSQAIVWDTRRQVPVALVPGAVDTLAFSQDSRLLATAAGTRSSVDVWDVHRMTRVAELTGHRVEALDVVFSPDGALLAVGRADYTVELWDVRQESKKAEFVGHTGPVDGIAFGPDGRTLATAGHDELVMLWDVPRGRHIATLEGHRGWVRDVAFSPDGRTLASASIDRTVRLWDVPNRRAITTLTGHTDAAHGIAYSPDGTQLAFTSDNRTVTLWDIKQGTETARLTGHTAPTDAITFSPDGSTLASVALDNTAILYPTNPATAATRLCSAVKRDLTPAEWKRYIPDIGPIHICQPE